MKRVLAILALVLVTGFGLMLLVRYLQSRRQPIESPFDLWAPPTVVRDEVDVEPMAASPADPIEETEAAPGVDIQTAGETLEVVEGGLETPQDERVTGLEDAHEAPAAETPGETPHGSEAEVIEEPVLGTAVLETPGGEVQESLTEDAPRGEQSPGTVEEREIPAETEPASAEPAAEERPGWWANEMRAESGEEPSAAGEETEEDLDVVTAAFQRLAAEGEDLEREESVLEALEAAERQGRAEQASTEEAQPPVEVTEALIVETEVELAAEAVAEVAAEEPASSSAEALQSPGVVTAETASTLPPGTEEVLAEMRQSRIGSPASRTAESHLDEGNVYFNVGQYSLAIDRYTRAIEADPGLVAAYYNRANARTRDGQYEEALSDYDRALELQPDDADALNNRGMLHLYRASYDSALRDFNTALAMDPTDTTVMVNRGLAHLHGGDPVQALADFQQAASLDRNDAAAHYGAGQATAQIGDRRGALAHLRRALELDPGYSREAAGDPKLAILQGDADFLRLLRESGSRAGRD